MHNPLPPIFIVCLLALIGCRAEEQITVYRIPKDASGLDGLRDASLDAQQPSASATSNNLANRPAASATGEATRMVVAIFQRDDAAWFFKISGNPDDVTATEAQWTSFIDDVKFEGVGNAEEPEWTLPDGWTTGPPAPFRFATVKLPESDLEIRISKLGGQQDLLSNVNRWRSSQLGLPPATASNVDDQFAKKEGKGGKYLLFDQQGESTGQSMGGPFMNRSAASSKMNVDSGKTGGVTDASNGTIDENRASAVKINKPNAGSASNPKFDLTPPAGFELGPTSAMVVARFVKETDDGPVQISVVPLTAINNWNDNVNFWRQSVGLEKIGDEEIEATSTAVTVSGIDGQRIELLGGGEEAEEKSADEESAEGDGGEKTTSEKGLIGVMVKKDDLAWFFKMMGPRSEVIAQKKTYDQFLKSFQFNE